MIVEKKSQIECKQCGVSLCKECSISIHKSLLSHDIVPITTDTPEDCTTDIDSATTDIEDQETDNEEIGEEIKFPVK